MNPSKPSRLASAPSHSSSVGPVARVPTATARPKSSYGQYGQHGRSKSQHQVSRPATAMQQRDDEEDDLERQERKGVHPFSLSATPMETLKVLKHAPKPLQRRPNSLNVAPTRVSHLSHSRAVSSPSNFRPITPVMEEPDDSCDDICNTLGELKLGPAKAETRDSPIGGATIHGKEANPFLKTHVSQIPIKTPARQMITPAPAQKQFAAATPKSLAPFLNRFTNDRCPDFYDDRIETMERDFRMFKEKMESDMQQSTDYKETIQQLQSRGE